MSGCFSPGQGPAQYRVSAAHGGWQGLGKQALGNKFTAWGVETEVISLSGSQATVPTPWLWVRRQGMPLQKALLGWEMCLSIPSPAAHGVHIIFMPSLPISGRWRLPSRAKRWGWSRDLGGDCGCYCVQFGPVRPAVKIQYETGSLFQLYYPDPHTNMLDPSFPTDFSALWSLHVVAAWGERQHHTNPNPRHTGWQILFLSTVRVEWGEIIFVLSLCMHSWGVLSAADCWECRARLWQLQTLGGLNCSLPSWTPVQ